MFSIVQLFFHSLAFPTIKTRSIIETKQNNKWAKNFYFSWFILRSFVLSPKYKNKNRNTYCISKLLHPRARAFSQVLILFNVKTEKSNFTPAAVRDISGILLCFFGSFFACLSTTFLSECYLIEGDARKSYKHVGWVGYGHKFRR